MSESLALKFYLDPSVRSSGVDFSAPRFGDAGFDLRAASSYLMEPQAQILVSTGLKVSIPAGYVGIIKDRSSMALRQLYTHAGVIDSNYRGEVKIVLSNRGSAIQEIKVGDKVAQLLVVPCLVECAEVISEEALGDTNRGAGGFGSTGR